MTFKEITESYDKKIRAEKETSQHLEEMAEKYLNAALRYQRIAATKMGQYYKLYHKASRVRKTTWVDKVRSIMKEINRITRLDFDLSDLHVFGLRCECPIFSNKGDAALTFTPGCNNELFLDTGEQNYEGIVTGSIAELNGYQNKVENVTGFDVIINNLKRQGCKIDTNA